MSHFNQYGNYYDPVGSQASRPSGYSYSTSPTTAAYQNAASSAAYGSGCGPNYQRTDGNTYNTQQYRTDSSQQAASSATHAAAALSSLSNQGYNQAASANKTTSNTQYDNASWLAQNQSSNAYSANNMSVPNRTQSNNSPLYSTAQSSSTFGRMTIPEQTQSSSNTFGASQAYQSANPSSATSNRSYQTAYTQQQSQPPRHNSPLHAVQAQQHGRGKQASPEVAEVTQSTQQNRQQTASVEPSPMTVDPSQVYDNRAELQRKAHLEAEKRRKYEAEQVAKREEEERLAEEKRKEEEAKEKAEKESAARKAEQERKNTQRRKAREEKKQSKSAASTLAQMAAGMAEAASGGGGDPDEEEMREMFQKMRQFNAKNPALLAKLWDEERKTHEKSKAQSPPQQPPGGESSKTVPAAGPGQKQGPKTPVKSNLSSKPRTASSNALPTQERSAAPQNQAKSPATANASLWPPHKKSSLSEATAKWLNAMPQNSNVEVRPATVLGILNSNPSYVELCQSLAGLGVKFDRTQLARELLRAVPDGIKAQPTTPLSSLSGIAPQANGSSASPDAAKGKGRPRKDSTPQGTHGFNSAPSMTVGYEAPISLSDAAREVNSMDRPPYQPSHGSPEQPYQTPYMMQSQSLTNGSRPASQSQPAQSQTPEVKQEMKPQEPPKPPADKEEAARKRTFGDLVDLTADDSDDDAPPPKKVMQALTGPVNGASNQPHFLQKPTSFDQFTFKPAGQSMATSPYFTLPSNGQMPPHAPIPGQQTALNTINAQQAARPTPPPPSKPKGPTPEQLQQARMRGKMLVEPIMRDRVARKSNYDSRTIARDVLLATGRHPDMRGLNAHFAPMQKLLASHGGEFDGGGNRSDLATIKWDIIDPVPPKEDKTQAISKVQDVKQESRPPPREFAPGEASTPRAEGQVAPSKPRRGRPPRQSLPDSDLLTNNANTSNASSKANTPARHTSARPATPSSAPAPMASSSGGIGYSAFPAQLKPDGTKKKGRPFGWKKSVHSREAQGLPKATHPTPVPSRLNQTSTPKQAQEVVPHYQEYKCQWDGCNSLLINLDTLKRHLVKVHGKESEGGEYTCWWEDCKGVKKAGAAAGRVVPATFQDIETWVLHIDEKHVRPIAWKLGDGPKGGVAFGEAPIPRHMLLA